MQTIQIISYQVPPPLPHDFRRHSLWALGALIIYGGVVCLPDFGIDLPAGILILLAFPAWLIIGIYLLFYVAVYPILHTAKRHRGSNQSPWLIALALELCGLGFGLVRLCYFFTHILPDIRRQPPYDSNRNT